MELPQKGRAEINELSQGIEISIPARKNWAIIGFSAFWFLGWCISEVVVSFLVITSIIKGSPNWFVIFWLGFWSFGGVNVFQGLMWSLIGKELITIRLGRLTLDRAGLLFSKSKVYDLKEVRNIRVQLLDNNQSARRLGTLKIGENGIIRFDYGLMTVGFGGDLDEAEANYIIEILKRKNLLTDGNFS